ncbi:DUF1206 domain-containing protein [Mesobaculum littorinae]|uniref:DUF1206 domain-containing protein n=1 Tax=Mesobaculum littorinae TaxID=2486419 RepID=A0A438ALR4_9RHOB|nr:DUF1206 domain-containing protein [Mesobaculum littorinae]RVV99527.1 DUF1206 domain-containing protein [Mesobaculum littorinae]
MSASDFGWAVKVMRVGYLGRTIVYLVLAGFSLWAIWHGGQAEGTTSALAELETTTGGGVVLALIALGMLAYAVWRGVDALWDLEDYGSGGKGIVARGGMIVTGVTHLAIGFAAASLLFGGSGGSGDSSSGGSSITQAVGTIMSWPGGRWIIGIVGAITIAAGIFYAYKGYAEKYREHLRANEFTMRWNLVLKIGLVAYGAVIAIVGLLLVYAALNANPEQAGGVGEAFSWVSGQPYGRALVAAICVGLIAFSIFCAVNAAYRIVPKAADESIESMAARMKAQARAATS